MREIEYGFQESMYYMYMYMITHSASTPRIHLILKKAMLLNIKFIFIIKHFYVFFVALSIL